MNRGKLLDPEVFCISDLKEKGSKKLPQTYREYFNAGAMDMITLHDNEAAYDRYRIRPRVLRNVRNMDISTTFLDTKVSAPFGFAPAAMHRLAHRDGELATSRAAAKMGIPMGLSAYATESCEDVISQGGDNPYIIQINFLEKREIMSELLSRAEKAGYKAVFLTVDVPVFGIRMNEYRNSFGLPKGLTWPNLLPGQDMSDLNRSDDPLAYECGAEWEEAAAFVRSNTKLPVWLKGIYTADDVALAIKHGFDGVVISNHGGRQLDGVPATLDALRECAPVAMGKIPIAIDGGIRRGTDIFKALALGADFCFLGRIPIWGLAYNGQEGVELAVHILIKELKVAMGISGCRNVQEINRNHLSILEGNGLLSKL